MDSIVYEGPNAAHEVEADCVAYSEEKDAWSFELPETDSHIQWVPSGRVYWVELDQEANAEADFV